LCSRGSAGSCVRDRRSMPTTGPRGPTRRAWTQEGPCAGDDHLAHRWAVAPNLDQPEAHPGVSRGTARSTTGAPCRAIGMLSHSERRPAGRYLLIPYRHLGVPGGGHPVRSCQRAVPMSVSISLVRPASVPHHNLPALRVSAHLPDTVKQRPPEVSYRLSCKT
jgi:hypothetical protein